MKLLCNTLSAVVLLWVVGLTCLPGRLLLGNSVALEGGVARVQPVNFSVGRGYYDRPFLLHLTTATRGAVIRYTRDGSAPTIQSGLEYADPIAISATTVLRATAFKEGHQPAVTQTRTYLFNLPSSVRALPVLSLAASSNDLFGPSGIIGIKGGNYVNEVWTPSNPSDYHNPTRTGASWERPVSVELIPTDGQAGFQIDAGFRVHGSPYTRARYRPNSQFSYRLYFRGEYGRTELVYPWFPTSSVEQFDVVVLRAAEETPIRDELTRQLHADMGHVASHGTFVSLFVNGVYRGLYNPAERIDDHFLRHWHGGRNDWDVITVGGEAQKGDTQAWSALSALLNREDLTQPAIYETARRRLDVVNFIDYLLLNLYAATSDWPHNNWRAGRERAENGIFRFYVWDAEGAFGQAGRSPSFNSFTAGEGGLRAGSEIAEFYQALRRSGEFRLLFADRVRKHFFNGGALTETNLIARAAEMQRRVAGVAHSADSAVTDMWIPRRRGPFFEQMFEQGLLSPVPAPELSPQGAIPPGGMIELTAPLGQIYFTTDESDPRTPFQGTRATSAQLYTGPITLDRTIRLKARTRLGRGWSALVEFTCQVGVPRFPLVFSEIHYHPPGGAAHQFLELRNTGNISLDLGGFRLDGVRFRFPSPSIVPAGGVVLLASSAAPVAFSARYPAARVDGWFDGNLANEGERLALIEPSGMAVSWVEYDDASPWPIAPDGAGPSLELRDPAADPANPSNWRASLDMGGSPGTANPVEEPPLVRLSELVNTSGWDGIELVNPGLALVNLSGWRLVHGEQTVRFPSGTQLAPGQFLWIGSEQGIGLPHHGLNVQFELNRSGGTVELFDAQFRRVDTVTFGPQLSDSSLAWVHDRWTLAHPTPAAANSEAPLAAADQWMINEWMFFRSDGRPGWVELYNSSTTLPASLDGLWLGIGRHWQPLSAASFVMPQGFALVILDDSNPLAPPGPAGFEVALHDSMDHPIDLVRAGTQRAGVSDGRFPDGAPWVEALGFPTPRAPNSSTVHAGLRFNEVLVTPISIVPGIGELHGWLELHNPTTDELDLGQTQIEIDGQVWAFPPGTRVPPSGHLVVVCTPDRPVSTGAERALNCGIALRKDSGELRLIGPQGQVVDQLAYGQQIPGYAIGIADGEWSLLAVPTPVAANSARAELASPTQLRINEWMSQTLQGDGWVEIFNGATAPVALSGLFLTDDPAPAARTKIEIPALSFIAPRGWAHWFCSDDPGGAGLEVEWHGGYLLLSGPDLAFIDTVSFGQQRVGTSRGRLPDGAAQITALFPSPKRSNYRSFPGLRIEEIHPGADWVEVFNEQAVPVSLDGWFLSATSADFKQVPLSIVVPPRGYAVLDGMSLGFRLDARAGGEVFLSETDAHGGLTGVRVQAAYPAAALDKSVGRWETAQGGAWFPMAGRNSLEPHPLYVHASSPSPGGANTPPQFGPVVLSEMMYQPRKQERGFEFIELHNVSPRVQSLGGWQVRGGARYDFGPDVSLPAHGFLVLAGFDPIEQPAAALAFRARYSIDDTVPLLGPFHGFLSHRTGTVRVLAPRADGDGFLSIEEMNYDDTAPWPEGAARGGWSLQRRSTPRPANDAVAWFAAIATPGAGPPDEAGLPVIERVSGEDAVEIGVHLRLEAQLTGGGSVSYQWRKDQQPIPGATTTVLLLEGFTEADEGTYDFLISNPAGSVVSAPVEPRVAAAPRIVEFSSGAALRGGETLTLRVRAVGSSPLFYHWYQDATPIMGIDGPSLVLSSLRSEDTGRYTVVVSNRFGIATSPKAVVQVFVPPSVVEAPLSQTVPPGGIAVFSIVAEGTLPITYRWRRGGTTIAQETVHSHSSFLQITDVQEAHAGLYHVVLSNEKIDGASAPSPGALLTIDQDTDKDGLPDHWELQHGLDPLNPADAGLDLDGDGQTARDEYAAQTDPTSFESVLRVLISRVEVGVRLEFLAQAGRTYTVEYSDDLLSGTWARMRDVTARSERRRVVLSAPASPVQRFYRIVTPRRAD